MRLVLDNPDISDQVIPDLARWEDWSILDQLVNKFKESERDAWIRQPVIAYLLTAAEQPGEVGQSATTALEELEVLDPEGVKRARSYMAFGLLARGAATGEEKVKSDPSANEAEAEPSTEEVAESTEALAAKPESIPPTNVVGVPSRFTLISVPLLACLLLMGLFALLLRSADVRSSVDA